MYTTEGLERGIEAAKTNIAVFEEAIEKEYAQIKEFRRMLRDVDRKAAEHEGVNGNTV